MLRGAAGAPLHLRTSLAPLDAALYGGIPAGSVTEVGPPRLLGGGVVLLLLLVVVVVAAAGGGGAACCCCRCHRGSLLALATPRPCSSLPLGAAIPPRRHRCSAHATHPPKSPPPYLNAATAAVLTPPTHPPTRPRAPQVVGPAGLGKTQLCLQLAVLGCLEREADGGSVAYLDTEKKFSAKRWGGCAGRLGCCCWWWWWCGGVGVAGWVRWGACGRGEARGGEGSRVGWGVALIRRRRCRSSRCCCCRSSQRRRRACRLGLAAPAAARTLCLLSTQHHPPWAYHAPAAAAPRRRLAQIARERFPEQYPSEEALAGMASRVLVFNPHTSQDLLHTLQASRWWWWSWWWWCVCVCVCVVCVCVCEA